MYLIFYYCHLVDTYVGGILDTKGIINPVVGASALIWSIEYILFEIYISKIMYSIKTISYHNNYII